MLYSNCVNYTYLSKFLMYETGVLFSPQYLLIYFRCYAYFDVSLQSADASLLLP